MGHKHSKREKGETIGSSYFCPTCHFHFDENTSTNEVNKHRINCSQTEPSKHSEDFFSPFSLTYKSTKKNTINERKNPVLKIKDYIKRNKVDWTRGCCNIKTSRENCLEESIEQIEFIDMWEELKISLKGELSYENDAGGLYREWYVILIEELEKKEMKLFEKADCDGITYVFDSRLDSNCYWSFKYFKFIGKLIAKSLIDGVTINLSFNNLIYKLILEEPVTLKDLENVDNFLYSSLSSLKDKTSEEISSYELYYVVQHNDFEGNLVTEELVPDGENKKVVTPEDVDDYIIKRINYIVNKAKIFVSKIQESLFEFIPKYLLKELNSFELELLICGQPFIDVHEWKANSIYQGKFSKSHKVIKWFWEEVYKLDQKNLRDFFQFSTGSSRVPINGFKTLESNRGEYAKFCLSSFDYNKKGINVIRAHTCFNRLDVPIFNTKEEVHDAIEFVLKNKTGFGIE